MATILLSGKFGSIEKYCKKRRYFFNEIEIIIFDDEICKLICDCIINIEYI